MSDRILLITINESLRIGGVLPSASYGDAYSATLTGYGGIEPYQWFLSSGSLPTGITAATDSSGNFVFSGSSTDAGNYPITVTLRDSDGRSVSKNFIFRVVALALTITGTAPDGEIGTPYSYTYDIDGGVPPYYFYTIYGGGFGPVPSGLTFSADSNGDPVLSGTPDVGTGGSYTFKIGVNDSQTPSAAFASVVNTMTIGIATLEVSGAFTDTDLGDPLNGSPLTITGGVTPYSLSGSPFSGTRPAGVSISIVGSDLVASGATSTLGTYSWTERVTSDDGQHFDVVCSVAVRRLWTPADLAVPPSIWLNETSAVTNVSGNCSQWNDISGNGWDFSQTTAASRPAITASAQNGLRGLTFDGVNDQMSTTGGVSTQFLFTNVPNGWVMYVGKKTAADGGAGAYRFVLNVPAGGAAGTFRASLFMGSLSPSANRPAAIGRRLDADTNSNATGSATMTNWHTSIGTMDYTNRTLTLYVNGSQEAQDTAMSASGGNTSNTGSFTQIVLSGNNPSSPPAGACNMVLGEVLIGGVHSSASMPTLAEVDKLAGWAAWKWGLEGDLPPSHPYKYAPPYV